MSGLGLFHFLIPMTDWGLFILIGIISFLQNPYDFFKLLSHVKIEIDVV